MGKRKRIETNDGLSLKTIFRTTCQLVIFSLFASQNVQGFFHVQKVDYFSGTVSISNNNVRTCSFVAFSKNSRDDDHVQKQKSMPLVLLEETDSSNYATTPPWLRKTEYSTPDTVEREIERLTISLVEHEFSSDDISDIVKAIYLVARGDVRILVGSVEFCRMILKLEEPGEGFNLLVTKDIILASILHYSECVTARQDGIYQKVEKALQPQKEDQLVLSGSTKSSYPQNGKIETNIDEEKLFPESSISLRRKLSSSPGQRAVDIFSLDTLRLAQEASSIKRAEILADVILTDKRVLSKGEYGDISNLLLSVMTDWRALAIRCVASLYRLEGILWDMPMGTGEYLPRDATATLSARYSIRVYAKLAKRLGLHRLQSKLEGSAFRILYPRQYSAVSTLFQQKGDAMKAVSAFLSSDITRLINEDQFLLDQLEDCEIQARVKEPYSFWKKIVKKKIKGLNGVGLLSPSSELAVTEVLDGVALRVIIKAAETFSTEYGDVEDTERMLCYYVHHLIRSQYPPTNPSRVKDYIKNPKPNGYQSLHHTSTVGYNDQDIPFEVQVRSERMHRIAEFGVAAHWDYKADNMHLLPPSTLGPSSTQKLQQEADVVDHVKGSSDDDSDSSYISALESARESLISENVYVFLAGSISELEGGRLLSLPAGSRVYEIFEQLEKQFGIKTRQKDGYQVWRNGQLSIPNETVGNGDVLLLQKVSDLEDPTDAKGISTKVWQDSI